MSGTPEARQKVRTPRQQLIMGSVVHDGEYRIESAIGHGGMGQVFLAVHTTLHVPFALKRGQLDQPVPETVLAELERVLRQEGPLRRPITHMLTEQDFPASGVQTDRFIREALLLARLDHPAIPSLYDYFIEDGHWYLVMDYIPGPTLGEYVMQRAPLPPLEALNYSIQLCDVLDYLHKQTPPVVFRDVKPSNVILSPDGRVMLVDFGIARYFKPGQLNDTMEFGSPGYAPPEQYQGGGQTDGRSDLYSLGVILHEMVSGKRPAGAGNPLESLRCLNPAISPALSGLVTVATRAEPMYRFQSARTFYLALERAYAIEERRAYRESVMKAGVEGATSVPAAQTQVPPAGERTAMLGIPSAYREQRAKIREALQEEREEREKQVAAETFLDTIDKNLARRSSMGFSSPSLEAMPPLPRHDVPANQDTFDDDERDFPPRDSHYARRIVRIFIALALIALIAGGSLRIAAFFVPASSPTPRTGSTPTFRATSPAHTPAPAQGSSWQALPSLPSPEADNTALYAVTQGRAYIYTSGGFRGPRETPLYDQALYRYDITAAHWETVSSAFPGMGNNAAALDEHGNMYFTAGYSPQTLSVASFLYMYQPGTNTLQKIAPPPQITFGFGSTMLADQHGHLYITQGFMKAGDPHGQAGSGWFRYDIATGQWRALAPLPALLGYVILAPDANGGILLIGGSSDAGQNRPAQAIYRYDIAGNLWTQETSSAPAPVSGAASCLNAPQQLVIIGGYNAARNSSLNQTWLVDLHTLRWQPLAPVPGGGSLLGTASCDGGGHAYVTRGANNPSKPTADFLELTLAR